MAAVRESADLDRLDGRIGLVLSLEGCDALGNDPAAIDTFWELGARMVSPDLEQPQRVRRRLWRSRPAAASAGGASDSSTGSSTLGAIVDLAHASERTFRDVLDRAGDAPLVVSHAACRALLDHPRNLSTTSCARSPTAAGSSASCSCRS